VIRGPRRPRLAGGRRGPGSPGPGAGERARAGAAGRTTPLDRIVAALRDPRRYPHPVERVDSVETHISHVLLAGAFAYKLKKPLELGFLDYSTLARRRRACEEEVRLNRRTAPELYLGVVSIGGTPDEPVLGGEPALEYAVKMKRFEQEALADRVAARGPLAPALVEELAATLADFHARADVAGEGDDSGSRQSVLAPALQNFDQLAPLLEESGEEDERKTLAELRAWTEREAFRLSAAFAKRKREGRVRECHGDLHLGNVVLLDGGALFFDCIEFDARLRWTDVMSEVAFLVMDLLDHGQHAAAGVLLDAYLGRTGDFGGLEVLPFYAVYRAMVRAKIARIRARQPHVDLHGRTRSETESRGYLALARGLTRPRPTALVLMHGVSGSGKSTVAARLVALTGAIRLRSDVERKRLFGLAPDARSGSAQDAHLYSPAASRATYERLAGLAGTVLGAGYPVVVDATFLRREEREAFRALARARNVPFAILSCSTTEVKLRGRVSARAARSADPSEATLGVLERQLAGRWWIDDDERSETIFVDTGAPLRSVARTLGAAASGLHLALLPEGGRRRAAPGAGTDPRESRGPE
jgi:hypothetical protein